MSTALNARKITLLTSLGAGFEYYDFVVYAMLAPWLSHYFFSSHTPLLNIIQTFAIFASGYLVRPLGGTLCAACGDVYGRKRVYVFIVALMSISSLAIACLPSYHQIGIAAPLLLLLMRLLQGISLGAELPGSIILLAEHAPCPSRGTLCGIQIACIGIGAALATFLCSYLSHILSPATMQSYGWRLLFVLGALLAVVAGISRRRLSESPAYLKQQMQYKPCLKQRLQIIKQQSPLFIQGFGMLILPASLVMFALTLPAYLSQRGISSSTIYPAMTVGYLWCSLCIPIFARAADKIKRRRLFLVSAVLGLLPFGMGLMMLQNKHIAPLAVWMFIICLQTWQASLSACYFTRLVEMFPTSIRYIGYALCYNLSYAIFGMLPMLLTYMLHKHTQDFSSLLYGYFILSSLISFYSVYKGRVYTAKPLLNTYVK